MYKCIQLILERFYIFINANVIVYIYLIYYSVLSVQYGIIRKKEMRFNYVYLIMAVAIL